VDAAEAGFPLRLVLRPAPLRSRPLAALVLVAPLRPPRLLVVAARLFPVRLLAVPFRLRPELLAAVRSLRLLFRSARPLFRSLRLPVLPRVFRLPEPERSVEAVREEVRESSDAAACSWSIRCPASLVQLCADTPRAVSWRAKPLAAVSFGNGPTSRRLDPA
jgi:hypothetical protein